MPYLGKQPVNLIKDNAVSTNKIADDAVTNAKLSNNAVNSTEIVDNAITTDKINGSAVTDAKLANDAVTTNKINNLAVEQGKIADQAINESKLQVSNAPVNNYVLTAQSGNTGGLTWASPAIVSGWNTIIENTEANGNRLTNVSQIDISLQKNRRYKMELGIYRHSGSTVGSGEYLKLQFSDVTTSGFVSNGINSYITRGGSGVLSVNNSPYGLLTHAQNQMNNGVSGNGIQGTWEYEQLFRTDQTQTLNAYMWGVSIGSDDMDVQTWTEVNTVQEIDLVRLTLASGNPISGDIRVLRRD